MYIRILTILLTAWCLFSCSSQDDPIVPDPKPNPQEVGISFGSNSGSWQDAATRATRTGLETMFKSFRVWSYKNLNTSSTTKPTSQVVMDGYYVNYAQGTAGTDASNTADWEYVGTYNNTLQTLQTIKYWDYSATDYRFMAYSPADAKVTISSTNTEAVGLRTTFSFPYEYSADANALSTPYVSELWRSTNKTPGPLYGKCVTLTFTPLIAKVRFKFTYPEGTTLASINNLQFCDNRFAAAPTTADTPLRGTLAASYPLTAEPTDSNPILSWTLSKGTNAKGPILLTVPYEKADDVVHILDNPELYEKWYYVPPLADMGYSQGAYTIKATIDGVPTTASVPASYMQWKAGYQYTYVFKISESNPMITFSDLQVEEWVETKPADNDGSGTAGW